MSTKGYRPTLAQLRAFVTIAETNHFGTAAAKLSISRPSLSQALIALENGLGIQMVERSTRKVIVTSIGEELIPLARATFQAADAFVSRSRGTLGMLTGTLTLGMIPTLTPYVLPEFLHEARADNNHATSGGRVWYHTRSRVRGGFRVHPLELVVGMLRPRDQCRAHNRIGQPPDFGAECGTGGDQRFVGPGACEGRRKEQARARRLESLSSYERFFTVPSPRAALPP